MADRSIVYTGAIPLDTDLLRAERFSVEGLGILARSVFGTSTFVEGLTVGPNSPAALSVVVQPGSVLQALALDPTAYGTLSADNHVVMQQAILRDAVTLPITPPTTAGQSRVYLVQAGVSVVDTDPTVLPYYNAADPTVALSGPNNSGTPQNTTRAVKVSISLKAGNAAATGSAVAPVVDAGFIALATVTVANGASSITGTNIAALATVPRIPYQLPSVSNALGLITSAAGFSPDGTANQPLTAMQWLFGGTGLLATNGYMRLPGGVLMQWGNTVSVSGATGVLFPTAFANTCRTVNITEQNATGWGNPPQPTIYGVQSADRYGFQAFSVRIGTDGTPYYNAGLSFNWIAVGY